MPPATRHQASEVTYANLADMLANTNRTGTFTMTGFGRNIVGSGSDVTPGGRAPLPEPATLRLLGLAMAGLGAAARRSRAKREQSDNA